MSDAGRKTGQILFRRLVFSGLLFLLSGSQVKSQDPNGIGISLTLIKPFQAGWFYPGSNGGTVVVSTSGQRTSTGTVILLYGEDDISPAIFELRTSPWNMVHIQLDNNVFMTSPTGGSIHLQTGPLSSSNVFVAPPEAADGMLIYCGGRIIVGKSNKNPPGNYSATFAITIICE